MWIKIIHLLSSSVKCKDKKCSVYFYSWKKHTQKLLLLIYIRYSWKCKESCNLWVGSRPCSILRLQGPTTYGSSPICLSFPSSAPFGNEYATRRSETESLSQTAPQHSHNWPLRKHNQCSHCADLRASLDSRVRVRFWMRLTESWGGGGGEERKRETSKLLAFQCHLWVPTSCPFYSSICNVPLPFCRLWMGALRWSGWSKAAFPGQLHPPPPII